MNSKMTAIIAIFNQCGGAGKTTLTLNVGYHLAQNKRVLLVDFDPQGTLTSFMGLDPSELTETIYKSLVLNTSLPIHRNLHDMDLIPANIHLCAAEQELIAQILRELKLKKLLEPIAPDYDFILIDCPPSLGLLSILALVAANVLLVPVPCQYKSVLGTDQLLETLGRVRQSANPELNLLGFVPTMQDRRATQDARMLQAFKKQLSQLAPVFEAIPRTVAFVDASERHLPLAKYKSHKSHEAVKILEGIARQIEQLMEERSERAARTPI